MTPPTGDGDRLASLLSRLLGEVKPAAAGPSGTHEEVEPFTNQLLYSFLLWESSPSKADAALAGLHEAIIDSNELRVALPEEIIAWTGSKDRLAWERAERLRAVLNGIYRREHRVSLASLGEKPKREVRAYLDGLHGMPSFVAARMTLFGFHGHAIPVDRWLIDRFTAEGVFEPGISVTEAEGWLERQIRASDAEQIVPVLEGWREVSDKPAPKAKKRTRKKAGTKSRAKKDS